MQQVSSHGLRRRLSKRRGDACTDRTRRRIIFQNDTHAGSVTARQRTKMNRAGVWYIRSFKRAPADQLVRNVADDLGIPFDFQSGRCLGNPMRAQVVYRRNGFEVLHKTRQVLKISPKPIQFLWRSVNGYAPLDLKAVTVWDTHGRHPVFWRLQPEYFVYVPIIARDPMVDEVAAQRRQRDPAERTTRQSIDQ